MAEAVRQQMEALNSEYNKLNERIWKKRYSLTAVGVLPTEILGEVFEQAVFETEKKHDMAAMRLVQPLLPIKSRLLILVSGKGYLTSVRLGERLYIARHGLGQLSRFDYLVLER